MNLNDRFKAVGVLVVGVTALLVSGCGSKQDAAVAAVKAADAQWSAAAGNHDVTAVMSFYTSDAVLLPPDVPGITNADGMKSSWAALFKAVQTIGWTATKVEVAESGEVAYETGTWTTTARSGHGVETDTGKLVEVWKKQPDGKWKCAVDMYNNDVPAAH